MAKYRCAACGSPKVMVDIEADGISYDYKKGFAGTMAFGTGGAVAGIQSNHREMFKCPDCGVSLSYPLQEPYKSMIDRGVDDLAERESLQMYGIRVRWERIKEQYPNIEDGFAEKEVEWKASNKQYTINAMIDAWNDDQIHVKKTNAELDVAETIWMQQHEESISQKEERIRAALALKDKECEDKIANQKLSYNREIDKLKQEIENSQKECAALEQKVQSLGFLQFSAKKKTNEQIEETTGEIENLRDELKEKVEKKQTCDASIRKEYVTIKEQVISQITKRYTLSESPKQRAARLKASYMKAYTAGRMTMEHSKSIIRDYLPVLLQNYGKASCQEMAEIMREFLTEINCNNIVVDRLKIRDIIRRNYTDVIVVVENRGMIVGEDYMVKSCGTDYFEYIG